MIAIKMVYRRIHPGRILKEMVFEPLNLSVSDGAAKLKMSRPALSRVLNGKAGISPDLAIRLEMAGISTARLWMSLQSNYYLWLAQQHEQPEIDHFGYYPETDLAHT